MKLKISVKQNMKTEVYEVQILEQEETKRGIVFEHNGGAFVVSSNPELICKGDLLYEGYHRIKGKDYKFIFYLRGRRSECNNKILTTKNKDLIDWLLDAVDAYNKPKCEFYDDCAGVGYKHFDDINCDGKHTHQCSIADKINKVDNSLEKAKENLDEYMEEVIDDISDIREKISSASTRDEFMGIKKEFWRLMASFDISATLCPYCLDDEDAILMSEDCKDCGYGKKHGVCNAKGSDWQTLREAQIILKSAIEKM